VFPKGMGNIGQLGGLMKQAMEMKQRIEEMKESLGDEVVEAETGAGMVKVAMNGRFEVLEIKIDPEIIDKEDPEMLEAMVRAGVNEAVRKAQIMVKEKMSELTGGMDIPGLT
jgi:nucleoid-associated protein EbfC